VCQTANFLNLDLLYSTIAGGRPVTSVTLDMITLAVTEFAKSGNTVEV